MQRCNRPLLRTDYCAELTSTPPILVLTIAIGFRLNLYRDYIEFSTPITIRIAIIIINLVLTADWFSAMKMVYPIPTNVTRFVARLFRFKNY
jgi:hypothetical protein